MTLAVVVVVGGDFLVAVAVPMVLAVPVPVAVPIAVVVVVTPSGAVPAVRSVVRACSQRVTVIEMGLDRVGIDLQRLLALVAQHDLVL